MNVLLHALAKLHHSLRMRELMIISDGQIVILYMPMSDVCLPLR